MPEMPHPSMPHPHLRLENGPNTLWSDLLAQKWTRHLETNPVALQMNPSPQKRTHCIEMDPSHQERPCRLQSEPGVSKTGPPHHKWTQRVGNGPTASKSDSLP
ncbi:hypothetical protein PAXRUDRAFT_835095 [Paxillus rubicundulus Ve08.2h10]|uniref:Uncharacterized protein n=1 Tax=Paxillus rubicundulus Ve08.2h10 TaxID=930991 RepID=A0A0D0DGR5_9AGAM|nr:hypothetical protein PAXRUDRAFT_835095 [Paxillus rubicundulus Ve08.2h10]